ncbi:MAG: hypothetical protein U0X91_05640 [Spirosomataceae bacterium]
MKKRIVFILCLNCRLCLLFCTNTYAQLLQADGGVKIRIYTFNAKRLDDVETYKNVLYAISDTSLVVVDKAVLISTIANWKAAHDGRFPSADSLSALLSTYSVNFQSLKWVKINKVSGAAIGFLAGIAIAAMAIFSGDSGYGGILFLGIAPPLSLLTGFVGGAVTPQRKFRNLPKYKFKERVSQRWRKYTVTEQLHRAYQ